MFLYYRFVQVGISKQVNEAFRSFLELNYNNNEHYVKLRESRKSRNLQDIANFKDLLSQHNCFTCRTSELISLSTVLVRESSVNFYETY